MLIYLIMNYYIVIKRVLIVLIRREFKKSHKINKSHETTQTLAMGRSLND